MSNYAEKSSTSVLKHMTAHEVAHRLSDRPQRKAGGGYLIPCVVHDDRTPSLSIDDGRSGVVVKCFAGCPQEDVLHRIISILDCSPSMPDRRVYREPPPAKQNRDAAAWLRKLIQGLRQDDGTVERYLDQRGLPGINCAALYLHPECWHSATRQTHPAMIGLITNLDGRCVGAHRTYLDPRNNSKADIEPNKMLTPAITPNAYRGTCIHLNEPQGDELSLAEGIETALAVYAMTGSAVWATCSASMLAKVEIPAHISRVNIWADNDRNNAGQDAARQAAQRLSTLGHQVTVHIPPRPGDDWLDVLIKAQEVSA